MSGSSEIVVGSLEVSLRYTEPPLLLLDRPFRDMLILPALLDDGVSTVAPPPTEDLFLAMLDWRVIAAALVALAGLLLLLDVPVEVTSLTLLMLLLPFEARLRAWLALAPALLLLLLLLGMARAVVVKAG